MTRSQCAALAACCLLVWATPGAWPQASEAAAQVPSERPRKPSSKRTGARRAEAGSKAQARKRSPRGTRRAGARRIAREQADAAAATPTTAAQPAAAVPAAPVEAAPIASDVRTEGDTQVKVMEFRGLDIEGQLRTPQMLYFLNRLRAEFGRPRLPHRSFLPELQQSTRERVF
jgi:hypothetical protein